MALPVIQKNEEYPIYYCLIRMLSVDSFFGGFHEMIYEPPARLRQRPGVVCSIFDIFIVKD